MNNEERNELSQIGSGILDEALDNPFNEFVPREVAVPSRFPSRPFPRKK